MRKCNRDQTQEAGRRHRMHRPVPQSRDAALLANAYDESCAPGSPPCSVVEHERACPHKAEWYWYALPWWQKPYKRRYAWGTKRVALCGEHARQLSPINRRKCRFIGWYEWRTVRRKTLYLPHGRTHYL